MGVGGSILHSVWKQDHYLTLKAEEDFRQQVLQAAKSKRSKNDDRSDEEFLESLFPQPVLCTIQYSYYLEHLESLPEGEEAKGKLQYIRLINKRRLFRSPVIHWIIRQYLEVLLHFECLITRKTETNNNNLSDYLPTIATLHHSRSLLYQEYEYRSGVNASDAYNIYQNIHEEITNTRRALERIFLWRSPKQHHYSDSFCELFLLSDCPKFTYISHRWVDQGQNPFGLHNELLLFLLFAKEDYIWLDTTCIPQVHYNSKQEDSDPQLVKLIWNIGKIILMASNIATYYGVDGWKTGLMPPPGVSNGLNSTSIGFLRLYQVMFGSVLSERMQQEIQELQIDGFQRLWCYFERYYLSTTNSGAVLLQPHEFQATTVLTPYLKERFRYKAKQVQASESLLLPSPMAAGSSFVNGETTLSRRSEIGFSRSSHGSGLDPSSILLSFHDHRRFHAERIFSLDCSNPKDLYPLTALLYEKKLLPFQFRKSQFLCQVSRDKKDNNSNSSNSHKEWICGFHLPQIITSSSSSSNKDHSDINTDHHQMTASYGWYRCPYYDEEKERERARYYFALYTSQLFCNTGSSTSSQTPGRLPNHDYLVLMFHEDCYDFVSHYYHCDALSYPASDLQTFMKFFERYAIAYEWEYYNRSYCQLCRVKEHIEYDIENGTLSPVYTNDNSYCSNPDNSNSNSNHQSRMSSGHDDQLKRTTHSKRYLSEEGFQISLPYDRR